MKLKELQPAQNSDSELSSFYISLADLMMLLLVFFLMLVSMSKIDTGSYELIRTGFTGSTKNTLVELAARLRKMVEEKPGIPGVKVHMAPDGVRLDLDTGALFETGKASLRPGALDPILPLLKEILQTPYIIDVEGHTDDQALHRFYKVDDEKNLETNWSLSGRRASSVVHHLLELGFGEPRIRLVGYASTRPLSLTAGKMGEELAGARAENRRVSLLVK